MIDVAAKEAKEMRKEFMAAAKKEAKRKKDKQAEQKQTMPSEPPAYATVVDATAAAPLAPVPHVYQMQLDLLASMGFKDIARNKSLLMKFKGNLPAVCNALIGV